MNSAIAISPRLPSSSRSADRVRPRRHGKEALRAIAFTALHVPIALMIYRVPAIAFAHAVVTLIAGIVLATMGRRRLPLIACWVGYVAGVEVIWRMAEAPIFWEYGKYSVSLVLLLVIVRCQLVKRQWIPIAYFALLVPSIILTIMGKEASQARAAISGNLSGPLALMLCGLFFAQVKLQIDDVRKLFLAVLIPTVGIAAITVYSTAAAARVVFTENSNLVTSGGFGPNQVSSTLGLGALAAWMLISVTRPKLWFKIFLFGVMGLLAVQSALTFSRGGLYNAAAGALLAAGFLMKDKGSRVGVILMLAIVIGVGVFIVMPTLEQFTGGALGNRFSNVSTSGRTEIVLADLEIWRDHPILGLGPGMAKRTRALYYERAGSNGAHTEFTRLLSEHGLLGLGALVIFFYAMVTNLKRARTPPGKAITAAMMAWSFLYMMNAAMRLVAPSFAFGLAFASLAQARAPAQRRRPQTIGRSVRRKTGTSPAVGPDGRFKGLSLGKPQMPAALSGEGTSQDG